MPGVGAGEVRLQPVAPGIRQGLRHRLPEAGPARAVPRRLYKLLPKIGPLRPLQFKAPTTEAEALFLESFKDTRERYRAALDAVGRGRLDLPNTDFDTGKPSAHGEYALADDTYAELLDRLTGHRLRRRAADALRRNINAFYAAAPDRMSSQKERKRAARSQRARALNTGHEGHEGQT